MRAVMSPSVRPVALMASSMASARVVAACQPSGVRGPCGT